ncbi:RnfABCDGE type electron transport complex subunit G [Chondrinema litorale]|uniref:RnfABCDGE type electron transport complex subunit G n=1 Tax=Chondrinema litorale TaxID=2994555 RepID=UPI0025431D91|nr:RnfABCDGE type electron transport complex subunit G [Chondrinema litorale]UZR94099.1 RnfABCDGE type electron transport complex subunit G [Chondrinema litorale]
MKKKESSFINMFLTLAVVTLVASASLGFVYDLTKGPIAKAQLEKQKAAISDVLPGFDNNPIDEAVSFAVANSSQADSLLFYPVKKENELLGYAVKTVSAKGYSGEIWLMVGINQQGEVKNIAVLDHKETPGLGSKISTENFKNQFEGITSSSSDIKVKKDGGEIDAISGATISSRAVCEAVEKALVTWKENAN